MNRLLPALLTLLTTGISHARTLAEAAQLKAKALPAGCIVTAEFIDGKTTFAIAGSAPEAKNTPPEKIAFEIGSITKVFTGLLLAQAVVESKVTLDTSISTILGPTVTFADPRVAAITLGQLSTHTSGLPRLATNSAAGMAPGDPYANYDQKLLLAYLQGEHLEGKGPYTCSYSNVGVGLLGYLLGKVYSTTWQDAVITKICLPLGLKDTFVDPRGIPIATPYSGKKAVSPWHLGCLGGAGALRSTAADMLLFGQAILHPENTPLKDAFSLALQVHTAAASEGGHIGLGIFHGKFEGIPTLHHDGGTGGYRTSLQVIPSRGIVRVALINNSDLSGSQVIAATSEIKAAPMNHKEITLSTEAMRQFPGVYELDRTTCFTVLLHNDKLWIRLTGQSFLPVAAMASDRFFNKRVKAEFAFNRQDQKGDGEIQSLTLFQHGNELTARRTGPPPAITLRTAQELQPYVGEYALLGFRKMILTLHGTTLFAKLEEQDPAPVFETSPDHFEYDIVKAALIFTRDDAKNINGLALQQNGLTLPAARTKPAPPAKK